MRPQTEGLKHTGRVGPHYYYYNRFTALSGTTRVIQYQNKQRTSLMLKKRLVALSCSPLWMMWYCY